MLSNAHAMSRQRQTATRAPRSTDCATQALFATAADIKSTHPEVRPSFAVTMQTVSNAELVPAAEVHQRGNTVLLVPAEREAVATAMRLANDAVQAEQLCTLYRSNGLEVVGSASWLGRASYCFAKGGTRLRLRETPQARSPQSLNAD